jgi:hypothetical protein
MASTIDGGAIPASFLESLAGILAPLNKNPPLKAGFPPPH